ncbi:MAG: acetoacetate decarboxylase family protein [Deltaproteobacteria bacterium]|nr:acetoacetate decarboxylase family protein [Deltaproteobacteria bacterium]
MKRKLEGFFDLPTKKVRLSQGEVDLPIFYSDYGYAHFLFWADYPKVVPKLEGTGFTPCKFFGAKAAVLLNFFEYRQTAIGPYNEVGLSILCYAKTLKNPGMFLPQLLRDAMHWRVGAYVINLPVTSEIAYLAGKEIWSYPKFVTPISVDLKGRQFRGQVEDPRLHKPIFELAGTIGWLGPGLSNSSASFISHTTHQGKPLRILTEVDARFKANLGFRGRLAVNEQSEHDMAANLLDMGLQDKRPIFTMYCPKARMILHEGVPIE